MELLTIKLNKAIKTIRKDGIVKGGQRVFAAGAALFRKVLPGDILIITGGIGDSARYRANHQAEELKFKGFRVSTTVQDNPFLSLYYKKFGIFIFHRVLHTPAVKRLIKSIKKTRRVMIFDTDDLVFDKVYLKYMDYYNQMNRMEKKMYENGVGGEILHDPYVRVCTTTTSFLAEKLRETGKTVFMVPNKLSRKDLEWADAILSNNLKKQNKDEIRIGYFSGSLSHNKDFATITDALMTILSNNPKVRLCLAGPLDIETPLVEKFRNKIEQTPYVHRKLYFRQLSQIDINLAPLEMDNPFCESKSELKFFEPGIVGVPTVAVRNRTFSLAIQDGINGFLALDKTEWIEKIEALVKNKNLRYEMGLRARHSALTKHTTRNALPDEYHRFLKNNITALQ